MPSHIKLPPYAQTGKVPDSKPYVVVHDKDSILRMKESCALAGDVLNYAGSLVSVGITTDEIDSLVHEYVIKRGAYPSPLNYEGFPKSICTSINEVVCHGIPDR